MSKYGNVIFFKSKSDPDFIFDGYNLGKSFKPKKTIKSIINKIKIVLYYFKLLK